MRNLKYIVLFTFFSQLFTVNTFAQTTYTLQQCINFALKNHRSLKVADNDVKVAYARKKEGQSAYFPQINGLVKWDYNMQLQKSTIPSLDIGGFMTPEQLVAFGNKFNTLLGVK